MNFTEITPYDLQANPFALIGKGWMLVTAGDEKSCNTMTVSWGQLGVMWNKPVVNVYLRPQRYTLEFLEKQQRFSLCTFAGESQRPALSLLGSKSGRDTDKIAEAGLHTILIDGVPAFEEADKIFICKKLYRQKVEEQGFLDPALPDKNYLGKDFHVMFIAEIEKVYAAR